MDSIWFEILVLILGGLLAIVLIVAILIAVKIIQIIRVVKRITEKAESMADKAEHVASFFEKTATPIAITKLVANMSESFIKARGKKK